MEGAGVFSENAYLGTALKFFSYGADNETVLRYLQEHDKRPEIGGCLTLKDIEELYDEVLIMASNVISWNVVHDTKSKG